MLHFLFNCLLVSVIRLGNNLNLNLIQAGGNDEEESDKSKSEVNDEDEEGSEEVCVLNLMYFDWVAYTWTFCFYWLLSVVILQEEDDD